MELYQKIVLGIALILLIAAYVMIYFTLIDKNNKWPPSEAKCPDFWIYNSLTDKCDSSSSNLGILEESESFYPSDLKLSQKSKCDKYKWANQNNISWDGLTYGVSISC